MDEEAQYDKDWPVIQPPNSQEALDGEQLVQAPGLEAETIINEIGFLRDVPLVVSVEIGRREMAIGEVLSLGPSAVIELNKIANDPLDIRVNGVLFAKGEAVVVNDRFGVRLTSLESPEKLLPILDS